MGRHGLQHRASAEGEVRLDALRPPPFEVAPFGVKKTMRWAARPNSEHLRHSGGSERTGTTRWSRQRVTPASGGVGALSSGWVGPGIIPEPLGKSEPNATGRQCETGSEIVVVTTLWGERKTSDDRVKRVPEVAVAAHLHFASFLMVCGRFGTMGSLAALYRNPPSPVATICPSYADTFVRRVNSSSPAMADGSSA